MQQSIRHYSDPRYLVVYKSYVSVWHVSLNRRCDGAVALGEKLTCCTAGSAAMVVSCGWKEIGASTDSRHANVPAPHRRSARSALLDAGVTKGPQRRDLWSQDLSALAANKTVERRTRCCALRRSSHA